MGRWQFTRGVHDLGDGCFTWLTPSGSWGDSNAGLVTDQGESLLVDTLFDLRLTREMLEAFRAATPAAARIGTLVNTHSNGDHTYGNKVVEGAVIVASEVTAREMAERPPSRSVETLRNWRQNGEGGRFYHEVMAGRYHWEEVELALPTRTFLGELVVPVGGIEVRLKQLGPAHTEGDVIAWVPAARTVFTGDIVFSEGHPVIWAGPVGNWIAACDHILGLDVETVVPGHGPVTDKSGVRALREYFVYLDTGARKRFDAGMPAFEAAIDIAMDAFDSWIDRERVVPNVLALYREYSGDPRRPAPMELWGMMSRYLRLTSPPAAAGCTCSDPDHQH